MLDVAGHADDRHPRLHSPPDLIRRPTPLAPRPRTCARRIRSRRRAGGVGRRVGLLEEPAPFSRMPSRRSSPAVPRGSAPTGFLPSGRGTAPSTRRNCRCVTATRRAGDDPAPSTPGIRGALLEVVPERQSTAPAWDACLPRAESSRRDVIGAEARIHVADGSKAFTRSVPHTSRIAASANSPATRNHSVRRPRGAAVVPLVVAVIADRKSPPTACSAGAQPNSTTVTMTTSDRERHDAEVHVEGGPSRQFIGDDPRPARRGPSARQQADAASRGRQHQVLDQELAHQPHAAGAERQPDPHFAPARQRAREHHRRDVRARDDQQDRDRAGHRRARRCDSPRTKVSCSGLTNGVTMCSLSSASQIGWWARFRSASACGA